MKTLIYNEREHVFVNTACGAFSFNNHLFLGEHLTTIFILSVIWIELFVLGTFLLWCIYSKHPSPFDVVTEALKFNVKHINIGLNAFMSSLET